MKKNQASKILDVLFVEINKLLTEIFLPIV